MTHINPVHVGQPSSFGSVFSDSPGVLRENGFTTQYVMGADTDHNLPICSGSAPAAVTDYQPVLPVLLEGDTLSIYGIQAAAGSNTTPLAFDLKVSGTDGVTNSKLVGTSNRNGPWFQHFELPIQIKGPSKVWMHIYEDGTAPKAYNRIICNLLLIKRNQWVP